MMKLVVTVDTEEDNWGCFLDRSYETANIEMIPYLQSLFEDFDITPTYLITYPVATNDRPVAILKEILQTDKCEIGTHCHPWNTPPLNEKRNERNSMLCNLAFKLQYEKLANLHNKIRDHFGIEPISFRAGRWGYDRQVAINLFRLGYKVDTSICSYKDWSAYHGPDFSKIPPRHYRFSVNNVFREDPQGELLEVPATVGFRQHNFELANRIFNIISRRPFSKMKVLGLVDKLKLLNKIWLSPEVSESTEMIRLTKQLGKKRYEIINLFFHSPSLKPGISPFVKTDRDQKEFFGKIREYLSFIKAAGIESINLSGCLGV